MGAATGAFVDDLTTRYGRYSSHLFVCFDDPRIPATTNALEGFFGESKRVLRQTLGCGSTTNSIVSNLGAEALLTYHQMQQPKAHDDLLNMTPSPADFLSSRATIDLLEVPGIRRRSMVRHLDQHVERLHRTWFGHDPPTDTYA